jgi:heme/copper-type cytochrome/quinol oxidase subunit 2
MKKLKILLVGAALLALPLGAVLRVPMVHASSLTDSLEDVNADANLGSEDLTATIGLLISALLSVLGVIFLLLIIWSGFTWMTAAGDPKKVDKAKDILITSVVGLIILLSAYAISTFVIDSLATATGT